MAKCQGQKSEKLQNEWESTNKDLKKKNIVFKDWSITSSKIIQF